MFVKLQQTCDRDVCAKFYDAAAELTDGKKPSPNASSKPYSISTSPLAHATHGALFDRGLKRNIIAIVEIINKIKLNST